MEGTSAGQATPKPASQSAAHFARVMPRILPATAGSEQGKLVVLLFQAKELTRGRDAVRRRVLPSHNDHRGWDR